MTSQTTKAGASEAGFGLAEALVAIIVFSIGLLAVAGMTMANAKQARASSYWTEQTLVAQDLMDSRLGAGYGGLTVGTRDTTIQVDSRSYSARISVSDMGPRARQVQVRVSGFEDTGPATLTSMVHWPRPVPEEYEL